MSKLIAGFALGAIATLALVYWFDWKPEMAAAASASRNSPLETPAEAQQANPPAETGRAAREDYKGTTMPTSAESVSPEDRPTFSAQVTVPAEHDARSTSLANESGANSPPNEYPPEIAAMIADSVDKELQSRYENDAREDSWAPYMEGLLANYFAQKPTLSQFYFSLIDCRTSICEIHALGYGPDALTQWNIATADLVSQQWFEFESMSMNRHNPEPDILGIVLILSKKASD